eukprot:TRINITY_DN5892_c0_g5_i1.p1 TRINITY_DN5892_c0_g5~~TRINITY_DN5892_c0_g5_i1.p1  ORF type:complete len:1480 (+),score=573.55 TRINITY_DN5892_c0_g5_i1:76-4515(+)
MSKAEKKKEEGVKVFLRIRPFSKKEIDESGGEIPPAVTVPADPQKLEFLDPMSDFEVKEAMSFDEIFWSIPSSQCQLDADIPFATQEYVYAQTGKKCLDHAFDGYNSCMLAYGQTGSGKTHSMLGNPADEGIIPKLCKELFETVDAKKKDPKNERVTYKISVSFLEIYNEKVKDLLKAADMDDTTPPEGGYKALRVRNSPARGPFVENLLEEEVNDWETCNRKIEDGFAARTTKATAMNAVSSRSHAIFKIEMTQSMKTSQRGKQVHTISSINLVDLAGSERANRTGAKGDTLTEGIAINQSLTVLRKVIEALMENGKALRESKLNGTPYKPQPPPYRESLLTWLLSESFGGNSKTMMIAAASPHESNSEETLQTLKYALKTKEIVNTVTRNEDKGMRLLREKNDEIEKLRLALENAAQNPNNSPENEAHLQQIQDRLRQEEAAKSELMEEHEKLTAAMEAKEAEIRRAQEERETASAAAKKEAEERARTQRAADIMGKWTRGFAYSLDNAKTKKLEEKQMQLSQVEEDLAMALEGKAFAEEESLQRLREIQNAIQQLEKERETHKNTLATERLNMQQEVLKTKERLREEHQNVVNAYKNGLQADNERLQRELSQLRDESTRTIAKLTDDSNDLQDCLARCKSNVATLQNTIDGNAASMDSTRAENRVFRQEVWDLKEANARLREDNSKLRLAQLQSEAQLASEGAVRQPTVKELRVLEAKLNDLVEDKASRVKDMALLKADKKALQMENRELELAADTAKKAEFVLQGKLLTLEAEHNKLKAEMETEGGVGDSALSKKDQFIMDLNAQLALLRNAKEKLEERVSNCNVENEQLRIELATVQGSMMNTTKMPTLPFSNTPHNFVSAMSGANRPAALVGLPMAVSPHRAHAVSPHSVGSPGMGIAAGTTVVADPPEGMVILNVVRDMDSKVTQCRKTLLLLRMQSEDEDVDAEETLAALEQHQLQIGNLLAEVSIAAQDTYENVKGILAQLSAAQQTTAEKTAAGSPPVVSLTGTPTPAHIHTPQRERMGGRFTPEASEAMGGAVSPGTLPAHFGVPSEAHAAFEKLLGEKQQLLVKVDAAAEKTAELEAVVQQLRREAAATDAASGADGDASAGNGDPTTQEKMKALEEEVAVLRARPVEVVEKERVVEVEKIVEVPVNAAPPDVEALQEQLEEAQGEAEFQEEMKDMLEEQLADFKDFEARYFKLVGALDEMGLKGEGSVDKYIELLQDLRAEHTRLENAADELAEAKKLGIGASADDYEFYVAKARILEETVADESAARAALERDTMQARYDLQKERREREAERRRYKEREGMIRGVFATYEEEVRHGFAECRDRHSAVWQELNQKKREVAQLRGKILSNPDPTPVDVSTLLQDGPVHVHPPPDLPAPLSSSAPPSPAGGEEGPGSPEGATARLLARHEQLAANRRRLSESIKQYATSPVTPGCKTATPHSLPKGSPGPLAAAENPVRKENGRCRRQ